MMKKTNVTVSFDPEKLDALRLYLSRKGADLEGELDDFLEKSYQRIVPAGIRDFISARQGVEESTERQPPVAPPRPAKTEQVKLPVPEETAIFTK